MTLVPRAAVAELLAENYTPLMLGDALGRVTEVLEGGRLAVLGDPVKAVIGKSRWLLRTLVMSRGYASTHREAERWPCRESDKSCLGTVQLAYGSASPAWRALYTIQAIVEYLDPRPDKAIGEEVRLSRYTLATMGVGGEEAERRRPLSPGALRIRVKILRRLGRHPGSERAPWLVGYDCLDGLVAASTAFTLRILGIGQGASRGFGLFRVKALKAPPKAGPLLAGLQVLDKPGSVKEALATLRQAVEGLEQLLDCSVRSDWKARRGSGSLRAGTIDVGNVRVYSYQGKVKWLEGTIWRKLPKNSKGIPPSKLRGIHEALEVIGLATLKLSWKIRNGEGRAGGGAYHTWILGLPRRQKVGRPVPCFGSAEEPPTGYLIESSEGGIRLGRASDGIYKVVREDGILFTEGRRESPLKLIPLDVEGRYIALIPIYPHDIAELVPRLYHAGGLATTVKGKTRFIDGVRLAKVEDIAGKGVGRVSYTCKGRVYVNDAVAGIASPGRRTHPRGGAAPPGVPRASSARVLVERAYREALNFLDKLLS